MVRSRARANPLVGSLLSLGAGWPVTFPESWIPRLIFRNRSPWMFTVIGSRVTIGPGFVVVVVETPGAAAALPPPSTNPFSPPRTPMAITIPMAMVFPLPALASPPSAAFFFAISRSSRGRCGRRVDLTHGRIGAVGDVAEGRPHIGQHDQLHPTVGGAALGGVVRRHRPLVGVPGGRERGRGARVPPRQPRE